MGLPFFWVEPSSIQVAVFAYASFATNDDMTYQLGFMVASQISLKRKYTALFKHNVETGDPESASRQSFCRNERFRKRQSFACDG